jgi:diguanylate cyclase (GGDEF)-like protein
VAVLFIDLDAFKFVNDSYSHGIGDRLLVQVAERIARQLSDGDIAGRIGGDEFTVLARHLILREDAASLANRLLATLSEPFHVDGCEIVLSASIGIAGFPLDGADALTLIANADAAMYAAKSEERNAWRFYAPMMHADTRRRLLLVSELRQALQRDEFTVLARGLVLREDAAALANRLLATLSEPFVVDGYEIVLSASIGIAGYPLDGADALTLIANADAAMYSAKSEERNTWRFYAPMMHADTRRRLQVATELRQALQRDEFCLVYQPSVEMRSGRILAAEALLRWQHPERGEVMPGEFIPVAESLGLIHRIDEWVMRAVCAQLAAWDKSGMPPIRVALNVSARWFGHAAFVESIKHTLQSHGVAPQRILLEITEGAMLKLGEDTERTMRALDELGIPVAVDDFGTGYASMAYLKLPAVKYLKIDRSFVTGLPDNANDAAITEAILAMAKTLGLCPIAEGIETEPQHEFLLRAGCVEGQGYLYSYPLPAAAIERMLRPKQQPAGTRLKLVPPKRR